ncbi:MAG: ATP/GTP-binding protein [Deltaproteobacteria bacterium]|nr:ATP/GTP-binding protein [Candidatus Zymogenaceae bacterium]
MREMNRFKVVVTGPFNSGKTQFIKTVSEIDVVSTERKVTLPEHAAIKGETTVAMDFGRITLGSQKIYLFGTPGQQQFDFMWEVLTENMIGFIVVVDSTDPKRFKEAREIIRFFKDILEEPFVVAANKQDLSGALPIGDLKKELGLDEKTTIISCSAVDKKSSMKVLDALMKYM